MVILTEDLILKKCNEDIDIDEINLSNLQITEIDPTAFKNFASLHTISLKNNQLRHLPKDLEFASPDKWWRLDLTNNRLNGYDSLEPLFNLTNFEELLVEDNLDISVEDEHKIQFKIPTVRSKILVRLRNSVIFGDFQNNFIQNNFEVVGPKF